MLKVIRKLEQAHFNEFSTDRMTQHLIDRLERLKIYRDDEVFLHGFIVDKQHKNGLEVHIISENGLIYIFNLHTRKFITVLNGRPQQIKRYFQQLDLKIDRKTYKAISIASFNNDKFDFNNK